MNSMLTYTHFAFTAYTHTYIQTHTPTPCGHIFQIHAMANWSKIKLNWIPWKRRWKHNWQAILRIACFTVTTIILQNTSIKHIRRKKMEERNGDKKKRKKKKQMPRLQSVASIFAPAAFLFAVCINTIFNWTELKERGRWMKMERKSKDESKM